jgi:tRNA-splicing ligase RtcB
MMADHHKGYGVPIGGVIAHENLVSPSADVRANIARIMDDVWSTISFWLGAQEQGERGS